MHSLLESYLSEVAAHLSALPTKQRNEELREMQAHLENAAAANRQSGQPEEEAMQNAAAQFGTPEELGRSTVTAWRRGVTRDWRDLGGAAAYTFLMLLLGHLLMMRDTTHSGGIHWLDVLPGICIGSVVGVCGQLFPRRAVLGVGIGIALFYVSFNDLFHVRHADAAGVAVGGLMGTWMMVRLTAWAAHKRLTRT